MCEFMASGYLNKTVKKKKPRKIQTEIKTTMQQSQQWKQGVLCPVLYPFYSLHPVQSWLPPQAVPRHPAAQHSQSVTLEGLEWGLGNSRF